MPLTDPRASLSPSDHISSAAWWILSPGHWWGSRQWGGQPLPCDSSKVVEVWMYPNKLSAHGEMCTCMQNASKNTRLANRAGGQQPAPPKAGGSWGSADDVTSSPHACVLGLHGRSQKDRWSCNVAHLPGPAWHYAPSSCTKTLPSFSWKVKQQQLVVASAEAVYCACSHGQKSGFF